MYLQLSRKSDNGFETMGRLSAIDDNLEIKISLVSLERPYFHNEKRVSCIPCGIYSVKKRWSLSHGYHFQVLNVPNRDMILIHTGNFKKNSLGCVLVGTNFAFLDADKEPDIINSRKAMKALYALMPKTFAIDIENVF